MELHWNLLLDSDFRIPERLFRSERLFGFRLLYSGTFITAERLFGTQEYIRSGFTRVVHKIKKLTHDMKKNLRPKKLATLLEKKLATLVCWILAQNG